MSFLSEEISILWIGSIGIAFGIDFFICDPMLILFEKKFHLNFLLKLEKYSGFAFRIVGEQFYLDF